MNLYKKILIALIIIILTYIIWRFMNRRREILQEGLSIPNLVGVSSPADVLTKLSETTGMSLPVMSGVNLTLPLKEFCIKGAYNAAYTGSNGNYTNVDMVTYVLSRGCRYLDFEVYYTEETDSKGATPVPVIAVNFSKIMTTNVSLSKILKTIAANAFSQTSPNHDDPIIINLRINANKPDIYKAVGNVIENSPLRSLLYEGVITENTLLGDVMGKAIISIDKTINPNYKNFCECNVTDTMCADLRNLVNIESGSEHFKLATYREIVNKCQTTITVKDDNLHTNISYMKLANPDKTPALSPNPEIYDFVYSYGYTIVPFQFYDVTDSSKLKNYEDFFLDNNGAFVPMAIAQFYFRKMKN